MMLKQKYEECLFLAEYYRWKAVKGHEIAGNNPITGQGWRKMNPMNQGAFRTANIALAKYWLAVARDLRLNYIKVVGEL